jgi:DNA-binding IscR family transcriptional regulator
MANRFPQKPWPRITAYELARERRRVTADEILRAAGTVEDDIEPHAGSDLLQRVVLPALAAAEHEFGTALSRINVEDMTRDAQALEEPEESVLR